MSRTAKGPRCSGGGRSFCETYFQLGAIFRVWAFGSGLVPPLAYFSSDPLTQGESFSKLGHFGVFVGTGDWGVLRGCALCKFKCSNYGETATRCQILPCVLRT